MTITIAHVNVARGYRGGERQTELLVRELAGAGVRQILIVRKGEPLTRRFPDCPIEVRAVSGQALAVASAARGADLVHVHEGRSVYAAWLRALVVGTPYVLTRRVNNPIGTHWLAHRAYGRAACIVAVAPRVGEIVRAYDPQVRIEVIHSASSGLPVSPANVAHIKSAFAGKFLIGHVGALDNAQKGHEYIIATARALVDTCPEAQIVLVGGGKDEAMLKAAAAGLPNVAFTGFIENVGDWLAAFDVFILPSNREGIGSILLDAMEQGLPVIASRVGGVPDIVRDGDNGILIPPASPRELEDAILRLHADTELRRALGARGKATARSYTAAVMARKYLAVYRSVLGLQA